MSDILLAFALVGLTMFGALILVGLHAALAGERRVHVYRRLPAPGGSTVPPEPCVAVGARKRQHGAADLVLPTGAWAPTVYTDAHTRRGGPL